MGARERDNAPAPGAAEDGLLLLVPIHLDALFLARNEAVLASMADFSRLPYQDKVARVDRNPDVPYRGEEIAPRPFQDQTHLLKPGVHLHWALPDALTRGANGPNGVVFPAVPDRWLVTRTRGTSIERQWIVESDYLYPETAPDAHDPGLGSISFPTPPKLMGRRGQPYRRMGRRRSVKLGQQPTTDGTADQYLNQAADGQFAGLTAIGYGEPSFAAFYPNCHSVFGLWDPDVTTDDDFKAVSYDVIGWFDHPDRDCLRSPQLTQTQGAIRRRMVREFEASHLTPDVNELDVEHAALEHDYGWTLADKDASIPKRVVCHGSLAVDATEIEEDPVRSAPIDVAIGHSGTEALSAHLAAKLPGSDSIVEEQLEALDLTHRVGHLAVDLGPKFREARHDKGFRAHRGGMIWTVGQQRPVGDDRSAMVGADSTGDGPTARDDPRDEPTQLSHDVAHALNRLNVAQAAWDAKQEEIASRRRQLYNDWSMFMLAAHTPREMGDDLPDPNKAAMFIEKAGIRPLRRVLAAAGSWEPAVDEAAKTVTGARTTRGAGPESLAGHVVAAIHSLLAQLEVENASRKKDDEYRFVLRRLVGPRYWRPTDPAVLLAGDAVRPTVRHGEDGIVECRVMPIDGDLEDNLDGIRLAALADVPDGDQLGARVWKHQPWHPFLMEWQVRVLPQRKHGTQHPDRRSFGERFVEENYELPETGVNLLSRRDSVAVAQTSDTSVYNGQAILTDYAPNLLDKLQTYLQDNGFEVIRGVAKGGRVANEIVRMNRAEAPGFVHGLPTGGKIETGIIKLVKEVSAEELRKDAKIAKRLAEEIVAERDDLHTLADIDDLGFVGSNTLARLFRHAIRTGRLTFEDVGRETLGYSDPIVLAATTLDVLALQPNMLSQALDGFNEALLQGHQTLQLPINDPVGFPDLRPLTEEVAALTQGYNTSSPLPLNDFIPIRSGQMSLHRLRLVDTFGRIRDVDTHRPAVAETMVTPASPDLITLSPRLAQPARINFRWLSAEPSPDTTADEPEMNSHPAYSPVCGWVLPNNLDGSLMVFDSSGVALCSVVKKGGDVAREPAPGVQPGPATTIGNAHLRRMVEHLEQQSPDYLREFLATIDRALLTIAPESAAHHKSLALLMGRPVAVVRASVGIQLLGSPAVSQDPFALWEDMQQVVATDGPVDTRRTHDDFANVGIPVRIGEYQQLNDGLAGYWQEDSTEGTVGYRAGTFFSPQGGAAQPLAPLHEDYTVSLDQRNVPAPVLAAIGSPTGNARVTIETPGHRWRIDTVDDVFTLIWAEHQLKISKILPGNDSVKIQTHWKEPINLTLTADRDQAPAKLTMLVDPLGSVHAVSGILPTKSINIPPDQYREALERIEITFHASPILTKLNAITMPLPAEDGFDWTWLAKDYADSDEPQWAESGQSFAPIDPTAHFEGRQKVVDGWLKLTRTPPPAKPPPSDTPQSPSETVS